MRRIRRLFTALLAVAGFLALAGGGFLWQQGLLRVGAQEAPAGTQAGAAAEGALPPPPKVGTGANAQVVPPAMGVDEARAWEKRLEDIRRDIDRRQRELELSAQVLAARQALLADTAAVLAELVGQLTGETPALQMTGKERARPEDLDKQLKELGERGASEAALQSLAADRGALAAVARRLAERSSREKRIPELKATIVEMEPKEAAALLSTGLKPELAAELLRAVTAEERAAIFAAMVKQNPAAAGALFARLGAVDGTSDANAGTDAAKQSATDAVQGKKG